MKRTPNIKTPEVGSLEIIAGSRLREALERLNSLSGRSMTLFVVDERGKLKGTLTDGDVRRGLLAGASLDGAVDDVMHRTFRAVRPTDTAPNLGALRQAGIELLPILDGDGRIERIIDLRSVRAMLPVDAVLMAGGRGERLRPLTEHTPKPLLPVGGRAIIDYNIDALRACGVENIYVTVNYLHEQLELHFAKRGDGVQCVLEPRRLGTMGSLALIDTLKSHDVLVMNSDLLTDIDFQALYERHRESGAALTMAVVPYKVSVPYAILELNGDRVTGLAEKPTYNYYANAGVYMMRADVAKSITKGEYLDATDLIDRLIGDGEKVTYFPIDGTWIDIGSPKEYENACKLMSK